MIQSFYSPSFFILVGGPSLQDWKLLHLFKLLLNNRDRSVNLKILLIRIDKCWIYIICCGKCLGMQHRWLAYLMLELRRFCCQKSYWRNYSAASNTIEAVSFMLRSSLVFLFCFWTFRANKKKKVINFRNRTIIKFYIFLNWLILVFEKYLRL